eukprot:TRINITY_DN82254_c0_g1_i1.p1 TRINITY_DN82254_c0_g1~~TRINITY_DN82254_c0_g1_i1.p1  ORF type:complete len:347 (-),score=113.70 TRINITY_DN82254_c0_g1_i1:82-1035(-)
MSEPREEESSILDGLEEELEHIKRAQKRQEKAFLCVLADVDPRLASSFKARLHAHGSHGNGDENIAESIDRAFDKLLSLRREQRALSKQRKDAQKGYTKKVRETEREQRDVRGFVTSMMRTLGECKRVGSSSAEFAEKVADVLGERRARIVEGGKRRQRPVSASSGVRGKGQEGGRPPSKPFVDLGYRRLIPLSTSGGEEGLRRSRQRDAGGRTSVRKRMKKEKKLIGAQEWRDTLDKRIYETRVSLDGSYDHDRHAEDGSSKARLEEHGRKKEKERKFVEHLKIPPGENGVSLVFSSPVRVSYDPNIVHVSVAKRE